MLTLPVVNKGRSYVVREGPRGGKYIIVKGVQKYV